MMHEDLTRLNADEVDREVEALARQRGPWLDRPDVRGSRSLGIWRRLARIVLGARAAHLFETKLPRVTIRRAEPSDSRALARLAELDERRVPEGPVLVAEVDEQIVAALPLDGSPAVSDPWKPTADVFELLDLRARQLEAASKQAA